MSPRPQIDHIRRPQLLDAAAAVIVERGFSATRIADVAERAGTSAPGVLYWFDSRDELLAEALDYAERSFYDQLVAEMSAHERPESRLAMMIDRSIGGDDWALWIELWTRALHDPAMRRSRQQLEERWRSMLTEVIAEGQATGIFGGAEPQRIAIELAALMDGLAVQVALGDSTVDAELMRSTCVEVAERLLATELPPATEAREAAPV